ncbi:MAG: hypothetical protein ABIP39_14550 [Polyangiaceae bacterium]
MPALFIQVATKCPRCGQPLPLNGASESVLCGTCQSVLPTPPQLWRDLLASQLAEATGMKETEGRDSTLMLGGSGTFTIKYGRLTPRCAKCKTKFDDAALKGALPSGRITCTCGTQTSVRQAPPWLRELQPLASMVVGETLAVTSAAPQAANKPTAIHCIQCGAQMQIDGKERLFNCRFCNGQVYLPDDLWLRLNPATTNEPWFVVIDMGDSLGLISGDGPNGVDSLHSIAIEPHGNMILVYEGDAKGDAGHESRIASVDKRGLIKWVQDGIEFSEYTWAVTSPHDGNLLLIDRQKHTGRWINSFTGAPIRTIGNRHLDGTDERTEDDGRVFDPFDAKSVMVDWDGSIVVRKRYAGNSDEALKRFAPDGSPIPLWPGRLARLGEYAAWDALPHCVQVPPDYTKLVTGWDGFTYIVGKQAIAKVQRDGTVLGVVQFAPELVQEIQAFGVDRNGVAYALFEHAEDIGDSSYRDILRVEPNGRYGVWLGPHAPASPSHIDSSDRYMAVFPDGTLYIGHGESSLRIIGPDGRTIWRSVETISSDEYDIEQLAERRKPKRVVRDMNE